MLDRILLVISGSLITASLAACAMFTELVPSTNDTVMNSVVFKAEAPTTAPAVTFEDTVTVNTTELDCLHKNIYWEARNQSLDGMIAVATVTLNRVNAQGYPSSICEVVYQAERDETGKIVLNMCQFSWYCDGLSDEPDLNDDGERKAWRKARDVAEGVLLGTYKSDKITEDALYYHADYVTPEWAATKVVVAKISSHIFYKDKAVKGAGA